MENTRNLACPSLASTAYLYQHNFVAGVVYWHLMRGYGFPSSSSSWLIHRPPTVIESSQVKKILWEFGLQSSSHHPSNCPDIVVFDFTQKICFIKISCPADVNVIAKEQEKLQKYQPLAYDYHLCTVELPVLLGCTGAVSTNCIKHLSCIPKFTNQLFLTIQRAVIVGSVHVL